MLSPKNYFICLRIEKAKDISFVSSCYRSCSRSYSEVYIIMPNRFAVPSFKTLIVMLEVVTQSLCWTMDYYLQW